MNHASFDRRRFIEHTAALAAGAWAGANGAGAVGAEKPAAGPAAAQPAADAGLLKFLFFDNRDYEVIENLQRRHEKVGKHPGNPLFVADRPWEHGNVTLYGSVVKAEGRPFQLWYTVIKPPFHLMLAYAESEDGLVWRKPELNLHLDEGRKTNLVFTDHPHGATVIYDAADPREDWKYKMLCGAGPKRHISAFRSADGIHWQPAAPAPVIGNNPDCPMSLVRRRDGTYAAHHRVPGGHRRIGRSESADFLHWHGGRIVLEPGPADPAQFEMYGMGATMYGDLELGTLWAYHTDLELADRNRMKGAYHAELTYSRSGWCWHRVAPGQPFIPRGEGDAWDSGNLQCASAPLFLDQEIRYYYAASNVRHSVHWELKPGRFGLGMASVRPDRFVALAADEQPGTLVTRQFTLPSAEIYLNADVARDGEVRMELLTAKGEPVPGFGLEQCLPMRGDSLEHRVVWQGQPSYSAVVGKPVRWRLRATRARLFSVCSPSPGAKPVYHRFRSR